MSRARPSRTDHDLYASRERCPTVPASKAARTFAGVTVALALAATATACGGGGSSDDNGGHATKTLTYWASNQGTSLDNDKQVLSPELDEVHRSRPASRSSSRSIGWADLLNRILAATTSGQGPDVLNIGNTWSASLQATGAFLPFDDANMTAIGGKDQFVAGRARRRPAPRARPPTAVPLYSLAYGLYYNKKMFADAGIASPPDHLGRAGRRRQEADQRRPVGPRRSRAAASPRTSHFAFIIGQQNGADFFDAAGKPTFDHRRQRSPRVKQYVDLMADGQDRQPERRGVRQRTSRSPTSPPARPRC